MRAAYIALAPPGALVVSLKFRHQVSMHQHEAVRGELKDFE